MEIETKEGFKPKPTEIIAGLYKAKLCEVKDGGLKLFSAGKDGKQRSAVQVVLIFDVFCNKVKEPSKIAFVGYAPATKGNKLGKALMTLGVNLTEKVDTDNLLGKECRVLVENYDRKLFDDTTIKQSIISKIMPLAE